MLMARRSLSRRRRGAGRAIGEGHRRRLRKPRASGTIVVRALHTRQGNKDVYTFFVPGAEITRIADIIRVARDERDTLKGFQRKEIRNHVRDIVQYLNKMNVL